MSYSMKTKLIIAVTSAVVLGMSAFIQPAEAAKKEGETYSQPSENEAKVEAQFSLVNQTRSGQPIAAEQVKREGAVVGHRFFEAIENYTKGDGKLCNNDDSDTGNHPCTKKGSLNPAYYNGYYYLDQNNFPIFQETFVPFEPSKFDGDLVAEFLNYGQEPLFKDKYFDRQPDKNKNNQFEQFFAENPNETAGIVYSIVKPEETEKAVFSYLLKLSDIPNIDRCQNIDDVRNKDKCRSVNDLEFILNNSLLSKAVPVRSINSGGLPNQARALIQNKFEQDVPVATVPEPSITLGALAAVGAGSLLKRKTKQN